MFIHADETPYKCDLCNKDFVNKSGLSQHMKCEQINDVKGDAVVHSGKVQTV